MAKQKNSAPEFNIPDEELPIELGEEIADVSAAAETSNTKSDFGEVEHSGSHDKEMIQHIINRVVELNIYLKNRKEDIAVLPTVDALLSNDDYLDSDVAYILNTRCRDLDGDLTHVQTVARAIFYDLKTLDREIRRKGK